MDILHSSVMKAEDMNKDEFSVLWFEGLEGIWDAAMKEAEGEMEVLVDLLLKKNNDGEIQDIPEATVWLSKEITKCLGLVGE